MKIFVDIDDTICKSSGDLDYSKSKPVKEWIDKVNELYAKGHHITMWTARGTMTGKPWEVITRRQLFDWGVHHHELIMGKPAFDLFIDDKVLRADEGDWINKVDQIVEEHDRNNRSAKD